MQNQFNTFKQGMLDALPIALAFLFVFCAYGALAYTNRYSLAQALFSTAGIFAVPLQLLLLITNHLPFMKVVVLTTIVNARFLIMSVYFKRYFKQVNLFYLLSSLLLLSASTFTVPFTKFNNSKLEYYWHYYLGVALLAYFVALLSTGIGFYLGGTGSQFILKLAPMLLPIHFITLTGKHYPKLKPIVITVLSFFLTPISIALFKNYGLLVGPLLLGGCFLLIDIYQNNGAKA